MNPQDTINIASEKIYENVDNAVKLQEVWQAVPFPASEDINLCRGETADRLTKCTEEAKNIHDAVDLLLTNTIAWCSQVGVKFEEADRKA